MRTEDGYIIHKCLEGESEAFGFLLDKYKGSIYAFAYAKLRNFHDAEDVTQEVFINAYQKLRTLRRWDNFLAWLYSITYNLCKMRIRARVKRPDGEFLEDQNPHALDRTSIDSYRTEHAAEELHEALNSLSEAHREVLSLHYLGGMKISEVARFLGKSPSTIDRWLRAARLQLKEEMLAMVSGTLERQRLQATFTLRIVDMVSRMRIHLLPRTTGIPWGISLAVGIILTIIGLSSYTRDPIRGNFFSSASVHGKTQSLKTGYVPVDMIEVSQMPIILSNNGNNNDGKKMAPKKQNADANVAGVKHTPDEVKAGDRFGSGAYIYGDYIIVGAPHSDGKKGAAYILRYDGTAWRKELTLTAKDSAEGDRFGWSAVITYDYAIVGAPFDDDMGEATGSVYIFRHHGGIWTEEAKLKPHGNAIKWCNFGLSISISGDYLIVGSSLENGAGGAIYIFHCDVDGKWEEQAKLISGDWAQYDSFGVSVSISGDHAIAGAYGHANNKGSAYIFNRTGDSWKQQAALVADDGEEGDYFGESVSISGDYAIVGAGHKGEWTGSAYIFYNDGVTWKQQAKLVSSDLAAADYFGGDVCISGNYALVGACHKDSDAGAAYAFLRRGKSWEERAKLSLNEAPNYFGDSISISGNYALIGAPLNNDGVGAVYIYNCITDLSLPVEPKSYVPATQGGVKSSMNIPNTESKPPSATEFRLFQNYPNPFNPETWIPYQLREDSSVVIKIHTPSGQLVRTLELLDKHAGSYMDRSSAAYWDGNNDFGEPVASGIYFYTIQTGEGYTSTKKMVVAK